MSAFCQSSVPVHRPICGPRLDSATSTCLVRDSCPRRDARELEIGSALATRIAVLCHVKDPTHRESGKSRPARNALTCGIIVSANGVCAVSSSSESLSRRINFRAHRNTEDPRENPGRDQCRTLECSPVTQLVVDQSDSEWDQLVASHPAGDLLQTSAWGETKRAIGLQVVLTKLSRPDGKLIGGGIIIAKQLLPGIKVGYVARGPIFQEQSENHLRVLNALLSSARSMSVRLLIIQPPAVDDPSLSAALSVYGFEPGCPAVAPEATIELDLTQSDDDLMARLKPDRRRRIRRALEAQGKDLSIGVEDDIGLFHRLHALTAARQHFVPIAFSTLRAQWDALAPRGLCVLLVARIAGRPAAALWLTTDGHRVTIKLGGWDVSADPKRQASEALHWEAVRWARASGACVYDLGGIDREVAELVLRDQPLPELFKSTPGFFKLSLGGSPRLFPRACWRVVGAGRFLAHPVVRMAFSSRLASNIATTFRNG